MLLLWFRSLGNNERVNIRNLKLLVVETFLMEWALLADGLIKMLHPEAEFTI